MCSPESSPTRKHAPPPFGTWGPVQCWEGLQRSPSDWQEGQTPRARAPDLVPFNIINAKRWRRSKVGFCPRLLPKKPFELFENAWLRGGPWLQESAPRLSVEPKIAFRIVRNGCSGSSKIAFSLKASFKKAGPRQRKLSGARSRSRPKLAALAGRRAANFGPVCLVLVSVTAVGAARRELPRAAPWFERRPDRRAKPLGSGASVRAASAIPVTKRRPPARQVPRPSAGKNLNHFHATACLEGWLQLLLSTSSGTLRLRSEVNPSFGSSDSPGLAFASTEDAQ